MCGIIFAANFGKTKEEPSNEWIVNQYQNQIKRGTQGFGVVFIQSDGTYKIARACEQTKILMDLYHKENQAPIILFHHRFPTSSENKMMESHPIEVDNGSLEYKYLMIHNGIISGANEVKEKHEDLGFVYTTQRKRDKLYDEFLYDEFNDSECLAIELARLIEKQTAQIEINGSMAFIILQINRKENKVVKMFFGRDNDTPLKMSKTRDKIRLSSEGEGNDLEKFILYSCNLIDFNLTKEKLIFAENEEDFRPRNTIIRDGIEEPLEPQKEITTIEELFEKLEDQKEEKNDAIENLVDQGEENINMILNGLKGELMRYNDTDLVDDRTIKGAIEKEIEKITETAEVIFKEYTDSLTRLEENVAKKFNNSVNFPKNPGKLNWHKAAEDTMDENLPINSIHSFCLQNPLQNKINPTKPEDDNFDFGN